MPKVAAGLAVAHSLCARCERSADFQFAVSPVVNVLAVRCPVPSRPDLQKSLSIPAASVFPRVLVASRAGAMRLAQQCRDRGRDGAGDLIPTRRSLLSRLKNWSDGEAWMTFFDTYWKLIYNAATQAGLSDVEAEDVVQETLIAVWKNISGFAYDPAKGSFKAWLLHQTAWRVKGQLRRRMPVQQLHHDSRSDTGTTALERVPDRAMSALEASWNEEWERNLLEAALHRVKAKVDAKQYQIFDLAFLRRWPVSKVARALRISGAGVYLAKHRVGSVLKKEVLRLRTKAM